MAVTAQEVFNLTMDIMDERLATGVISVTDTKIYNVKTPSILTMLQAELIEEGAIFSTYEITNKPATNILGYTSHFNIEAFEGTEKTYEASLPCQAYYFEANMNGTAYIEDYNGAWNTLKTITINGGASAFVAYKGIVTPTSGATKSRIRFSGTYRYLTVNRALFNVPFATDADVPDYRPWVKKQLPSDFKTIGEIINEYPERQYAKDANYKWEGRRDLYINYYYEGNIRITYKPVPNVITALTDTMQVDDVTARTILPYGLAVHLTIKDNPDIADYFDQRFNELKAKSLYKKPLSFEAIENLYGT